MHHLKYIFKKISLRRAKNPKKSPQKQYSTSNIEKAMEIKNSAKHASADTEHKNYSLRPNRIVS